MSGAVARGREGEVLPYGEERARALLGAFEGTVEPVLVPPLYRLGLLLSAAAMVLLPLVYVGLIGLVSYGVYHHAVHRVGLITEPGHRYSELLYAGPLVIGTTLILFMVKPLFARPAREAEPTTLDPNEEPLLFAFVAEICRRVGAPEPVRIVVDCQVNASASLRRGLRSFSRQDFVLTIGLPLAGRLSVEQLAGVLAHEFGHFAQGAGMRLSLVVRWISHWFERVVYERDALDLYLTRAAERSGFWMFLLIFNIARACVWLSRRLLQLLMGLGAVVSSFLMRQMEHDADRYEARLVGRAVFVSVFDELGALTLAFQRGLEDLQQSWRDRRLADDFGAMVFALRDGLRDEELQHLRADIASSKTEMFDTHPAVSTRIARAEADDETGSFSCAWPASHLFRDFSAVSRRVSLSFYEEMLGSEFDSGTLIQTERLLAEHELDSKAREAAQRLLQAAASPQRPFFPKGVDSRLHEDEATKILQSARQELLAGREEYTMVLAGLEASDETRRNIAVARVFQEAGVQYKLRSFFPEARRRDKLDVVVERYHQEAREIESRLGPYEDHAAVRLGAGLAWLRTGGNGRADPELEGWREEAERWLEVLRVLVEASDTAAALRDEAIITYVLATVHAKAPEEKLGAAFESYGEGLHPRITTLQEAWAGLPYPFDHSSSEPTLAEALIPGTPDVFDIGGMLHLAFLIDENTSSCVRRVLFRLCLLSEQAEARLGLGPLESPL